MKRKLLSLLLALGLCFGMAAPALAVEGETPEDTNEAEVTSEAATEAPEDAEETAETTEDAEETAEEADEDDAVDRAAMALEAADALYELGLFKGVGDNEDGSPNYELERAATRAEAVTMLVRLLGQETAAQNGDWETPFVDVADWAKPYVGYAYANGLTLGTGETTFGSDQAVSAAQYLTFVLRALGYSSETDFAWDSAWEFADEILLTDGYYNAESAFDRGEAAIVSNNALLINIKDGEKNLLTVIEENLAAAEEAAAEDAEAAEAADEGGEEEGEAGEEGEDTTD